MIYIIRHGETDANQTGTLRGSYFDDDLNAAGHAQAKATAEQLAGIHFDICYCSPMKRTIQTLAPIYSGEVILDKRLIPRDYGELIKLGETAEYIDKLGYWNRAKNLPVENGESISQVEERIQSFFDEIKGKHAGKNILVVTHGSLIGIVNAMAQNWSLGAEARAYKVKNCAIVKIPN